MYWKGHPNLSFASRWGDFLFFLLTIFFGVWSKTNGGWTVDLFRRHIDNNIKKFWCGGVWVGGRATKHGLELIRNYVTLEHGVILLCIILLYVILQPHSTNTWKKN